MLPNIDVYLLNKAQKISDQIQDWSGIDNFVIARMLAIVSILFSAFQVYFSHKEGSNTLEPFTFLIWVGILSYSYTYFLSAEKLCKNNSGFMNPTVVTLERIRVLFTLIGAFIVLMDVPLIIFSTVDDSKDYYVKLYRVCFDIKQVCYIAFLYFGSCTPKPRKPSKLKQFFGRITENAKNLVPSTKSPEPAVG